MLQSKWVYDGSPILGWIVSVDDGFFVCECRREEVAKRIVEDHNALLEAGEVSHLLRRQTS